MINRFIGNKIKSRLDARKIVLLFGARQVGKTTLLKELVSEYTDYLWYDADDPVAMICTFSILSLIRLRILPILGSCCASSIITNFLFEK